MTIRTFSVGDQVGLRTIDGASGIVEQVLDAAGITIYWVAYSVEQGAPVQRGFYTADQLMGDEELWQQEVTCWGEGDSVDRECRVCHPEGDHSCTTCFPGAVDRDQLAQKTAEYIAGVLIPESDRIHALPGVTVFYTDDKRPPREVADIKAALLGGAFWTSWIGEKRVTAAFLALHGEPARQS